MVTDTSRDPTKDGTLTNDTDRVRPAARATRAVTRPLGTSMTTSTVPSAGAATRPASTAYAPSAIVPWPQAVEKPSLCQNSTPSWAPGSGGTRKQPYMSACPRGSLQSRARSRSAGPAAAASRRSSTVAPGMSGAPPVTIRNGSPAVW